MFRINFSAVLVSMAVFSGLAYMLDPVFIQTGESLLMDKNLEALWTSLYQQDLWRLSHFNNTLTLGSLVISLLALLPVFFISKFLIIKYREKVLAWILKSRLVQALKATKWVKKAMTLSRVAGVEV